MVEGSVVSWSKQAGDWVEKGEVLFTVETDKAEMEVEATDRGYLGSIQVELSKKVPVGTVIALLSDQPGDVAAPHAATAATPVSAAQVRQSDALALKSATTAVLSTRREPGQKVPASPRARRLAAELGIDITAVLPGPGRETLVEEDVRRFQAAREETPVHDQPAEAHVSIRRASVTRKLVAQRMTDSFRSAPHFYLGMEANATDLVKTRNDLLDAFSQQSSLKLTYTDLFLRALAIGLKEHPEVNAYWGNDGVQRREGIAVSFAVQTPEGLLAPVIQEADRLSLLELARQRATLTEKARAGRLSLEEMEGGSATLTNLGTFGIDWFEAILNPPQSVILATGRIAKRPAVVNDALQICPTLVLTLSVDHRVLDGVGAAIFLVRIKELIENPSFMLS